MARAMLRVIVLVVLVSLVVQCGWAQPIRVLTLDASRNPVNFVTNPGFSVLRNDLLNPANFGPSGLVPREVSFLPQAPAITAASLANADVVMWVPSGGPVTSPTPSELALLSDFVSDGHGLFVFGNRIGEFAPTFGGTPGGYSPGVGIFTVTITDGNSPMASGPFGLLPTGSTFPIPYHGFLADAGPSGNVAMTDVFGIVGASFEIGNGRAALIGDSEIFLSSHPGLPALPLLTPNSRTVFLNTFAYTTVPEPGSLTLIAIGMAGVAWRRKRTGRRSKVSA